MNLFGLLKDVKLAVHKQYIHSTVINCWDFSMDI